MENKNEGTEFFTFNDIVEAQKNQGQGIPIKPYDPYVFWNGMGEKYFTAFDRKEKFVAYLGWILDRLKVVGKVENLLDAGCGFGRLLPFILDSKLVSKVEGVDISERIIKCADDYLKPTRREETDVEALSRVLVDNEVPTSAKEAIKPFVDKLKSSIEQKNKGAGPVDYRDQIPLKIGDVRDLSYQDNQFDVVLSVETIQHLNPHDARLALSELFRVAKKAVILCERWAFPNEHSEPHIWSHNISEMVKEINPSYKIAQVTTVGQGIMGIVALKE